MDKQRQLRKHKLFATMLFFIMAVVYVVCEVFFKKAEWAGYVKAFAEAAMVGALADWFAVVALFKHPLGIPIPHTNLIESSKKKIGNNLGNFVIDNFLNEAAIKPRLDKLFIAEPLGRWLQEEANRKIVTDELNRIIKDIITKLNNDDIVQIIYKQAQNLVEKIPLHSLAGSGLEKMVKENMHQDWITTLATYLRDFLEENKDLVKQKVKDESHFLIPGFVDTMIAGKITNGGIRYMNEIVTDMKHPARKKIGDKLLQIAIDVKEEGLWSARLTNLKNELLSPEHLTEYSATAWHYIKKQIEQDIDKTDSAIANYIDKVLFDIGNTLTTNSERQERIDKFVQAQALEMLMKYRHEAGEMISQTVANWPSRELSNKLELEVGKDLQFIRINGTLVGGMVGLIIYLLTKLIN